MDLNIALKLYTFFKEEAKDASKSIAKFIIYVLLIVVIGILLLVIGLGIIYCAPYCKKMYNAKKQRQNAIEMENLESLISEVVNERK